MPRAFIGWSFPADLGDQVGRIAATTRNDLPSASWTRSETYHLTFAFLGDQEESTIVRLGETLVATLRTVLAARAFIGEAGLFPSDRRPRVGWLGLEPEEPVIQIGDAVREVLDEEEVAFDRKPFHPHLTIVRPKARWSRADVEHFLAAWQPLRGRPLLVDSVTLFESRLGPGGARHIVRAVAPLRL